MMETNTIKPADAGQDFSEAVTAMWEQVPGAEDTMFNALNELLSSTGKTELDALAFTKAARRFVDGLLIANREAENTDQIDILEIVLELLNKGIDAQSNASALTPRFHQNAICSARVPKPQKTETPFSDS